MADKLTLIELHLHAEDNEFESDMEFSSDIGDILRRRFGFGGSDDDETTEFETDETETTEFGIEDSETETDSLTAPGTADGGDAMEGDEETETGSAVVEIDPDVETETDTDEDFDEEFETDDSGGRSTLKTLFVLMVLAGLAFLARQYLGGDELDDEFEEL